MIIYYDIHTLTLFNTHTHNIHVYLVHVVPSHKITGFPHFLSLLWRMVTWTLSQGRPGSTVKSMAVDAIQYPVAAKMSLVP